MMDATSKKDGMCLGSVLISRGWDIDSNGHPIDPEAFYFYETDYRVENKVTIAWRAGLSKPDKAAGRAVTT